MMHFERPLPGVTPLAYLGAQALAEFGSAPVVACFGNTVWVTVLDPFAFELPGG